MATQTDNLRCEIPSSWRLFVFFATNYLAHCATIRAYPAENLSSRLLASVLALFMPASGVVRAMDALIRHSRFYGGEEIQRAVRAGAVCMLVRTEGWIPRDGDIVTSLELAAMERPQTDAAAVEDKGDGTELLDNRPVLYRATMKSPDEEFLPVPFFSKIIDIRLANVHGTFRVPQGYEFAYIPCDVVARHANRFYYPTELEGQAPRTPNLTIHEADAVAASASISSNYDISKSLIAIAQTIFGAITLYEAGNSQLDRYGYAAYGLTVVPFLIMSLVNLASQIATADYPAMYMIQSPVMDEARRRGGVFDGAVGTLEVDDEEGEVYMWRATAQENQFSLEKIDANANLTRQPASSVPRPQPLLVQFGTPDPGEEHQSLAIPNHPKLKHLGKPMKFISREAATSIVIFVFPALVISLSLLIIGLLTHFRPGHSTVAQRAWTMTWLAVGIVGGAMPDSIFVACTPLLQYNYLRVMTPGLPWWALLRSSQYLALVAKVIAGVISLWGIFFAPAIGGFVVVGQMINELGLCERQ